MPVPFEGGELNVRRFLRRQWSPSSCAATVFTAAVSSFAGAEEV